MVDLIMPVIRVFWLEEQAPPQWNRGIITNVWKGKADHEKMENQRGITVSSSIGTIAEEVFYRRSNSCRLKQGAKRGPQQPTTFLY